MLVIQRQAHRGSDGSPGSRNNGGSETVDKSLEVIAEKYGRDAMTGDKGKMAVEEAADKVNDAVEDLTLKAADAAIEPAPEHNARIADEKVRLSETSESASLPDHIDPNSVERAARERQKYIEHIVATAASSSQVRNKTEASRTAKPRRRRAGAKGRLEGDQPREEAMADKASFTKEEWTLLLESPMIVGMAVTAADPSGLWGLLKESFAGGSALTQAVTGANTNPLVNAVVTDFSTSEGRSAARDGLKAKFAASQAADFKKNSIDSLRQISALLDAKAPGDAAAFKAWLGQISQSTAEAATEGGGLFGIGGVQVSDAEKATLAEISTALGA